MDRIRAANMNERKETTGKSEVEGKFRDTHKEKQQISSRQAVRARSAEGVLQVSGEPGRGLSASDFLSYLSFSSSLTPVILLLPYPTLSTAAYVKQTHV